MRFLSLGVKGLNVCYWSPYSVTGNWRGHHVALGPRDFGTRPLPWGTLQQSVRQVQRLYWWPLQLPGGNIPTAPSPGRERWVQHRVDTLAVIDISIIVFVVVVVIIVIIIILLSLSLSLLSLLLWLFFMIIIIIIIVIIIINNSYYYYYYCLYVVEFRRKMRLERPIKLLYIASCTHDGPLIFMTYWKLLLWSSCHRVVWNHRRVPAAFQWLLYGLFHVLWGKGRFRCCMETVVQKREAIEEET